MHENKHTTKAQGFAQVTSRFLVIRIDLIFGVATYIIHIVVVLPPLALDSGTTAPFAVPGFAQVKR